MLTDQTLPGYRFPLSIIGRAVWLYHRYTLSLRDVEELLFERDIEVSRESIRTWCINFSDDFAQGLRHREPRRGVRWHLDEMHVFIGCCQLSDAVQHTIHTSRQLECSALNSV